MDIFIIYLIKTLLLPISSLLILSFIGLFLIRQWNFAVILVCFSLSLLLVLSLPVVTKSIAIILEKHPPLELESLDDFSAQAIVIISGGVSGAAPEYSHQGSISSRSLVRARYATWLAKRTNLPLLVSGGKVLNMNIPSEAEIISTIIEDEFNQIVRWQEQNSRNTIENAFYTKKILSQEGISRIILVTHAFHMPRAVDQFEQQGFQVLPAPTVFLSKTLPFNFLSFIPSAKALSLNTLFIHEIMGRTWMIILTFIK